MTQYIVYSRQDSGGNGHIAIRSRADLSSAWGAETTIINYNDSGLDAATVTVRFPHLVKDPDATGWYLFFSSEESPTNFRIYRAHSSDADPTATSWGSITLLLSGSGTGGAFDENGVAGPFVFRLSPGDWRMLFTGYDASDFDTGSWEGGMASATAIDGTWTRDSGNPIWPKITTATTISGTPPGPRVFNVSSTTGFSVGQAIVIGGAASGRVKYRPTRIRKILSSTQLETWNRMAAVDTQNVAAFDGFSIQPRMIRKPLEAGYDWEMWATIYRFQDGEEGVGRYLGVGSDPADATWALATDHGFPWVGIPYLGGTTTGQDYWGRSAENIGFIVDRTMIEIPTTPRRVAIVS